jgi:hypothetical protein
VDRPDDFYEDDEDPEQVHAAFEGAEHGLTHPPVPTWTSATTWAVTWPNGGEPGETR